MDAQIIVLCQFNFIFCFSFLYYHLYFKLINKWSGFLTLHTIIFFSKFFSFFFLINSLLFSMMPKFKTIFLTFSIASMCLGE